MQSWSRRPARITRIALLTAALPLGAAAAPKGKAEAEAADGQQTNASEPPDASKRTGSDASEAAEARGTPEEPTTLVVKAGRDGFGPALATSWTRRDNSTVFTLKKNVAPPPAQIASILRQSLANAKVSHEQRTVTVSGIPQPALLRQLAGLSLTGDGPDPLADLAGLGVSVVARQGPEGGGSIRAGREATVSDAWQGVTEHTPAERMRGRVIGIERAEFPNVRVRVRIWQPPKGPLGDQLERGSVLEAPVLTMLVDEGDAEAGSINVQNLVAYYLQPGDKVALHARRNDSDAVVIDWIERR